MTIDEIRALASAPPPPPTTKYSKARDAAARIVELENVLGIAHGNPIFNIGKANARIDQLESLVAAMPARTVTDFGRTQPTAGAAVTLSLPPAQPAAQISTAALERMASLVLGSANTPFISESATDAERREKLISAFAFHGLALPGAPQPKKQSGFALTLQAGRQKALNEMVAKLSQKK